MLFHNPGNCWNCFCFHHTLHNRSSDIYACYDCNKRVGTLHDINQLQVIVYKYPCMYFDIFSYWGSYYGSLLLPCTEILRIYFSLCWSNTCKQKQNRTWNVFLYYQIIKITSEVVNMEKLVKNQSILTMGNRQSYYSFDISLSIFFVKISPGFN